jgi:hypothetical protein
VVLGWHGKVDPARCASAALELLSDPHRLDSFVRRARGLIDGRGVWRALDALLRIIDTHD